MTQNIMSKEVLLQFLTHFDELADREDFTLIRGLVHEHAVFRFNDGDFVGRAAVQAAFEKTWASSAASGVKKERFYLSDIVVLSLDHASAAVTYTYNWEGAQGGKTFRIQGRGTRVVVQVDGRLQIIHEHLSRFPKAE
jgi:ketosteroid isomerase-like protein